jgi:hypothetical protein
LEEQEQIALQRQPSLASRVVRALRKFVTKL